MGRFQRMTATETGKYEIIAQTDGLTRIVILVMTTLEMATHTDTIKEDRPAAVRQQRVTEATRARLGPANNYFF